MTEIDPDAEQRKPQPTLDIGSLSDAAIWLSGFIAGSIASGVIGNSAYDFLKAWKKRFGRNKTEELEKAVYDALKRVKRKPNVSNQDLRNRAAKLFQEFENK